MTVTYGNINDFHLGIAYFVRQGYKFKAYADDLRIEFTGGY